MNLFNRRSFLGSVMAGSTAAKEMASRLWGKVNGGPRPAQNIGPAYQIQSPNITVELSGEGNIVGIVLGTKAIRWPIQGGTFLAGCQTTGTVEVERQRGGGLQFKKKLVGKVAGAQREVTVFDTFLPTKNSVRWEIRLVGQYDPWSTPIETHLEFDRVEEKSLWTPWGDPEPDEPWKMDSDHGKVFKKAFELLDERKDPGWNDPFTFIAFPDRTFWYGAPYYRYDNPMRGQIPIYNSAFCVPLATVIESGNDSGMSLALSPEDVLLDMTMETTAAGSLKFSRLFRRISGQAPVDFSLDLVAHEADWRGGLRWMTERYAEYFQPPLPSAAQLGGTGAYSSFEGNLDAEKFKRMAFTVNWKASFDYPYQGMFMPPVPDGQEWARESPFAEGPQFFIGFKTSVSQLASYSHKMREAGFHVLNYFDVAEFGKEIIYPASPFRRSTSEPDFWKDPNDFLYAHLADALVFHSEKESPADQAEVGNEINPGPIHDGWHVVFLDWGEPSWQNFLLNQASALIQKLPDSSGICIDRGDYLRLYNFRRDDGLTWYDGAARSMISSWKDLMEKLGPLQHKAGQALFENNHVKRLDTLRHVDGLFDESTSFGTSKNLTAVLGMFKPTIGWVREEDKLKPDPDTFMQRFLYLGVFPMAPFPQNDHSILPGERADKTYIDYGPMLQAMRGRTWVLLPRVITVERSAAKANLFRVAGGYVIPVVLGGSAASATVNLRGIPEIVAGKKFRCEVIHPGESKWKDCEYRQRGSGVTVNASLDRGCAMVRLLV